MSDTARRARASAGFTLIEVLAVLFLTALVLGAALTFYIDLSNDSARATETTREVRRATTLIDRIARDVERALLVRKPADTDPLAHPWIFLAEPHLLEGGADRLKFVMRSEPPRTSQGPTSDLSTIAYTLEQSEDAESFELHRWTSPHLPERLDREFPPGDDPASLVLADGISHFALRFLAESGEWVEAWDSSQLVESSELPVAVEIELALAPAAGSEPEETAAEPMLYARRVLLPMRPLDLVTLLDPTQVAANSDGDADEDCEFTVADCIDWSKVGGSGAAGAGAAAGAGGLAGLPAGTGAADLAALGDLVANAPTICWDQYRALYGSHPAVRDFCPMRGRCERGVVLVIVLVFALLLASTIATFLRRATIDHRIAHNREATGRAESLARGGVQLAGALLLQDKLLEKQEQGFAGETLTDLWAMAGLAPVELEDGSTLRLIIEDASSRLNLNAVLAVDEAGAPNERAAPLLGALLDKVIEEIPLPPAEKLYDRDVLVQSLIDHVDPDETSLRGGSENDAFERGESPVGPADRDRPLLSLDELRLVEGFDSTLVEALRPYVTVYPYAGTDGINPNTAPPHVLALVYYNDGVELRLASEDTVRQLLAVRQEGGNLCGQAQSEETCTPIGEIVENANAIFPPLWFSSDVFVVTAEARVGSVRRSIEAVVDRSQAAPPLLLSWRVL